LQEQIKERACKSVWHSPSSWNSTQQPCVSDRGPQRCAVRDVHEKLTVTA